MRNDRNIVVSDYDCSFCLNDDMMLNKIAVDEFRNRKNLFVMATGRRFQGFMSPSLAVWY